MTSISLDTIKNPNIFRRKNRVNQDKETDRYSNYSFSPFSPKFIFNGLQESAYTSLLQITLGLVNFSFYDIIDKRLQGRVLLTFRFLANRRTSLHRGSLYLNMKHLTTRRTEKKGYAFSPRISLDISERPIDPIFCILKIEHKRSGKRKFLKSFFFLGDHLF